MSVCGGEEAAGVVRCLGVPNGFCSAAGGLCGVLGGSPLVVTRCALSLCGWESGPSVAAMMRKPLAGLGP